jgi:lysophospholipase L1-like esterase/Ca2+-binding EF-hand superfamily protein
MRTPFFAVPGAALLLVLVMLWTQPGPIPTGRRQLDGAPEGSGAGVFVAGMSTSPSSGGEESAALARAARYDPHRRTPAAAESPQPGGTTGAARRLRKVRPDIEQKARALFLLLDENEDGRLNADEMPTSLRSQLSRWDANQDGLIGPDEFLEYFKHRVRQYQADPGAALSDWSGKDTASRRPSPGVGKEGSGTSTLPPGLTAWFRGLDTNNDGQIGLSEWRAAGLSLADFQKLDGNGDGFLTPREIRAYVARQAAEQGWTANSRAQLTAPAARPAPPATRLTANQLTARHVAAAAAPSGPPAPVVQAKATAPTPTASPAPSLSQDATATVALPLNDGTNAYWTQRNLEDETVLQLGGTADVLFLGDSITDWLATGVGQPAWDNFFEPLGAVDFAVAGVTTSQVLWQVQQGQVEAAEPRVVVLMVGTNNLALGQSPAAVADGITAIVDGIQEQLPETQILLLGILPRGESPADPLRQKVAQVNDRISELAGGRVRFRDIGAGFLEPDSTISPAVMPDYLHPSLLGYEIYTASVWWELRQMLGSE